MRGEGGRVTVVIIYACVCCSVDMCSGDVQFISRLVRLVKHFMPASVLDPSQVRTTQKQLQYPLCWVSSLRFVPYLSPSVHNFIRLFLSPLLSLLSSSFLLHSSTIQRGYLHGKFCLLAFDALYEKDGQRNRPKTTLVRHFLNFKSIKQRKVIYLTRSFSLSSQYIPNDYAFMLAKEFPEYFYAIGSVNPYRVDALAELERCAQNGVTIIKWLVSC